MYWYEYMGKERKLEGRRQGFAFTAHFSSPLEQKSQSNMVVPLEQLK